MNLIEVITKSLTVLFSNPKARYQIASTSTDATIAYFTNLSQIGLLKVAFRHMSSARKVKTNVDCTSTSNRAKFRYVHTTQLHRRVRLTPQGENQNSDFVLSAVYPRACSPHLLHRFFGVGGTAAPWTAKLNFKFEYLFHFTRDQNKSRVERTCTCKR